MPFTRFQLPHELAQGVKAMGFTSPTPIQAGAIPPALEGRDVLGSAQTGSGKTVAFALPMLVRLMSRRNHGAQVHGAAARGAGPARPRAVVLIPTRELAAQVETAVRDLGRFSPVRCALVIGGASFHLQREELRRGAEIVVATPGRLLDHMRSRTLELREAEVLVLDEADRMLDMGFMPDVRRILSALPKERQTLMFSATVPPEVESVVREFMRDPVRVEIDRPTSPAAGITQNLYPVEQDQKLDLLLAILAGTQIPSGVIFTRTKHRADRVAKFLGNHGIPVAVLHSNKTQGQRTQALDSFRDQKRQFLVATDIASRGIDVRHITHVINFDVPLHPEDYVHRIGRTGRVFAAGDAISLMSREEERLVMAIEKFIGTTIPRCVLPDFQYKVQPSLVAYKPPVHAHFRLRRRIARSSRLRFRR